MHRSGNEDSFLVADLTAGKIGLGPDVSTHQLGERGSLMIVSDGMGGAAAGEIASEMAVTSMRDSLAEVNSSTEISEQLKSAAEIANERLALNEIKRWLDADRDREAKLDEIVRRKIATLSRKVPPGSREWDILYQRYLEEEHRKQKS